MATELATFGGGCFWCLEASFIKLKGVLSVMSGYSDGTIENPDYQKICTGTTGHAEVIQISFDPELISYLTLLEVFFELHDPTTLNQQGADIGTQYRSIILSHNEQQNLNAKNMIAQLNKSGKWSNPIVTEVKPIDIFYEAESYHQNYFKLNPTNRYCQIVITPKLRKLDNELNYLLK